MPRHNDQDIWIAQYLLGLLAPLDAADTQKLLSTDRDAAQCALTWEARFIALVDALPPVMPAGAVLDEIRTALDLEPILDPESVSPPPPVVKPSTFLDSGRDVSSRVTKSAKLPPPETMAPRPERVAPRPERPERVVPLRDTAAPELESTSARDDIKPAAPKKSVTSMDAAIYESAAPSRRLTKSAWLAGIATALMLTTALSLAFLPRTPVTPPATIIEVAPTRGAILQAPGQSSTPGWVLTVDEGGNVILTPKVRTEIPTNASVQLWTYTESLPEPRSLGLLDPNQAVAIPVSLIGEISDDQFFEMTQEPEGGSPTSEPTGPVLFIGRTVTFGE